MEGSDEDGGSFATTHHRSATPETIPIATHSSFGIDAIAKMMGMEGVFSLRSADVYRVLGCDRIAGPSKSR